MDQTIPDWLNKTFLSTCLQGNGPDASPITINWYDVTAGVAPGNNYGSVILRVKVKYREENRDKDKSLIIKGPISNSLVDAIVKLFGMAEYSFYYLYLPKLADILKDWITPKAYHTPMSSVIVLEDLSELGFTMADRQKQLDFDHCKQYFTASAKFHAAGVVLANQHPELIEKFPGVLEKMIKSSDYSQLDLFMHDILVALKCLIKSIEVLGLKEYKPYLETIRKFVELNENSKDYMRELGLRRMAETNKKMFKSFIHGDCWTTNMMFKHNQSGPGPTDIRLIDFQGFRYDSVVSDIINFTWMSCNNDVLQYHLNELYCVYCDTLNSTLEEYGCSERYSFESLKEEVCENSLQVLSMVCMMLPLTQHDELIDSSKMFTGKITEEDIIKFYRGTNFSRKFPQVLRFVADQGIFDHMEKDLSQYKQL